MVDDTATCSDSGSTCEVFSTLDGTTSMDGEITLSKCRNGIICNTETNAINLNSDLSFACSRTMHDNPIKRKIDRLICAWYKMTGNQKVWWRSVKEIIMYD